ncbi:hypothetical protein PR202_ga30480 [Eleusine coracana subsp. coracana]|uniref:FYVE-type domain-containing protein n=1 Tax=Eleusine coracana subsp. coracana TaxID=191504 RepID=A0AAV5DQ16_ELECO|nr:hypothetical protein PR202_ga30480 [Eleusine coracana subsp. coracana]
MNMAAPREVITYHPLPAPGAVNSLKDEIQSKVMETVENAINSFDPKSLPQHIEGLVGTAGSIINSFEPKWARHKEFASDGEDDFVGYECPDEYWGSAPPKTQNPVNLKNVLGGIVAMIGRSCKNAEAEPIEDSRSSVSFLGSSDNGDTFLHSSVYMPMPSAPPLLDEESLNYNIYSTVIEAEPPEWLPDSYTSSCMQCAAPFTALTRGRHHCRFCGAIFCRLCSKGRCLLPVKFCERNPQRVCDACYDRLDPLQNLLIHSVSNASQTAKHDVMDWTCSRGWLNLPIGLTMEHEIYKAANSLRIYGQAARLDSEKSIPHAILSGASGLAILTVVKAGAILTYKIGTGLVVARKSDGSWSAPSAIAFGWFWMGSTVVLDFDIAFCCMLIFCFLYIQVGGQLMDFIIVLHGPETVQAFSSHMHFSLGAGVSAAAGPIGRVLEADMRAGDKGSGVCYTYSCSKGAFVGVSLEGNIVATRMDANLRFYGDPYLTT